MVKKISITLFEKGDRVQWNKNEDTGPAWLHHDGQLATVTQDQLQPHDSVEVQFDARHGVRLSRPDSLTLVKSVRVPTLHDEAEARFELAMTYARDGAIATASSVLEEIAYIYRMRANSVAAYENQGMPVKRRRERRRRDGAKPEPK